MPSCNAIAQNQSTGVAGIGLFFAQLGAVDLVDLALEGCTPVVLEIHLARKFHKFGIKLTLPLFIANRIFNGPKRLIHALEICIPLLLHGKRKIPQDLAQQSGARQLQL